MTESETFENQDFTQKSLMGSDFDSCEFVGCNFTEAHLGGKKFLECTFRNCEMSGVKVRDTAFRECTFSDCKLMGVNFDVCNTFLLAMDFKACRMDLSNFFSVDLTQSQFNECSLVEADLCGANLKGVSMTNCKLSGTLFDQTNFEKADLSGCSDILINPSANRIIGLRLDKDQLNGLLRSFKLKIN
jgi:fluoroquinolone resistance protein